MMERTKLCIEEKNHSSRSPSITLRYLNVGASICFTLMINAVTPLSRLASMPLGWYGRLEFLVYDVVGRGEANLSHLCHHRCKRWRGPSKAANQLQLNKIYEGKEFILSKRLACLWLKMQHSLLFSITTLLRAGKLTLHDFLLKRYAQMLSMIMCCMVFAPAIPAMITIAWISCFISFWADKIFCKYTESSSESRDIFCIVTWVLALFALMRIFTPMCVCLVVHMAATPPRYDARLSEAVTPILNFAAIMYCCFTAWAYTVKVFITLFTRFLWEFIYFELTAPTFLHRVCPQKRSLQKVH